MDKLDQFIRRQYGVRLGEATLVELRKAAAAHPDSRAEVRGRDVYTGKPRTVEIDLFGLASDVS